MKKKILLIISFVTVLLALTIQRVLFPYCHIGSDAMEPTMYVGEGFFLNKFTALHRAPRYGEIVAVRLAAAEALLLRRVVGLAGDTVTIHASRLYINGEPRQEAYLGYRGGRQTRERQEYGPCRVPAGEVFLLADNREVAADSRFFGAVGLDKVVGFVARDS